MNNENHAGGAADRSSGESTSAGPHGAACAKCTRYRALELELGECRARPPVVFMLPIQAARLDGKAGVNVNFPAAWPRTAPHDWCGEFADRWA